MEGSKKIRVKKRIRIRKKVSKKKLSRIRKFKEKLHQIFSFLIVVFTIFAAYFLIWGLLIEPNLPRHIYGQGDFRELILLLIFILLAGFSYLGILLIRYKPLHYNWWDHLKLFYVVKFDLEKYAALRNMGIEHRHRKKKTKKHRHHHHKSITEE
jgi:amino acid transporter